MKIDVRNRIKLFAELWKLLFKSKAEYRFNFFMDVCIYRIREFINYPISIYSTGIQIFLTIVIPYGFVNFYPVEALLNKRTNFVPLWIADMGGILLGGILIVTSYKFFMRYVNKYQSTGS